MKKNSKSIQAQPESMRWNKMTLEIWPIAACLKRQNHRGNLVIVSRRFNVSIEVCVVVIVIDLRCLTSLPRSSSAGLRLGFRIGCCIRCTGPRNICALVFARRNRRVCHQCLIIVHGPRIICELDFARRYTQQRLGIGPIAISLWLIQNLGRTQLEFVR